MDRIRERYEGGITPNGHELHAEDGSDGLTIWYAYSDELNGVGFEHRVGVARVQQVGETYRVGWFAGDAEKPSEWDAFPDAGSACRAIDSAIKLD